LSREGLTGNCSHAGSNHHTGKRGKNRGPLGGTERKENWRVTQPSCQSSTALWRKGSPSRHRCEGLAPRNREEREKRLSEPGHCRDVGLSVHSCNPGKKERRDVHFIPAAARENGILAGFGVSARLTRRLLLQVSGEEKREKKGVFAFLPLAIGDLGRERSRKVGCSRLYSLHVGGRKGALLSSSRAQQRKIVATPFGDEGNLLIIRAITAWPKRKRFFYLQES